MNQPKIFLLEEDNDTRPLFKKVLEDSGYYVLLAVDEKDALNRIDDGFHKSDLIVINLIGKSTDEMLSFGRRMREDANRNVPLIVVAAKYDEEQEGTSVRVADKEYILYLGAGDELFDLLSKLTAAN